MTGVPYPPNPPEDELRATAQWRDANYPTVSLDEALAACAAARADEQECAASERNGLATMWKAAVAERDSWWRSRLVSDEAAQLVFNALVAQGSEIGGVRMALASLLPVNEPETDT